MIAALLVATLAAHNVGFNVANFNLSKEFAIVDMGWCKDKEYNYKCKAADVYGGFANSSTFLGAALGCLLISTISRKGKRNAFIWINILNIVGCVIATTSHCFYQLFLGKLIAGMSAGLCAVTPIFLSEISPSDKRGLFSTVFPIGIMSGQFLLTIFQLIHGRVAGANPDEKLLILTVFDKAVWRLSVFLPAVTSFVSLYILLKVFSGNTPYDLLKNNLADEAKQMIVDLHGEDKLDAIFAEVDADQEIAKETPNVTFFTAIKAKENLAPIIVSCCLAAIQQLGGANVFISNTSKLFLTIMGRTYLTTVVSSGISLVIMLVHATNILYIDRLGRRTLLLIGSTISSIFLLPPMIAKFVVGPNVKWVQILSIVGCFGYIAGYAIGYSAIMWLYFSEALSGEYKNAVNGVCGVINWLSAFTMVCTSDLLISYNEVLTYALYTGGTVFSVVFVILFVRETRGDRKSVV